MPIPRRLLAPALLALVLLPARAEDPKPAAAKPMSDLEKKALDRINFYRKLAGVREVVLDPDLSVGCQKHAEYLVQNYASQKNAGQSPHEEFEDRKGYSKEGAETAKQCCIIYQEPAASVDYDLGTLFHRIPYLEPNLERVGLGIARGNDQPWYVVIDVNRGNTGKWDLPYVLYPADKQQKVPLLRNEENPNPIPNDKDGRAGYPVTVTFKKGDSVRNAKMTLRDGKGKDVPFHFSTPDQSVNVEFQANTLAAIAQDPLVSGTTYTASFEAEVNGEKVSKTWTFSTSGKR